MRLRVEGFAIVSRDGMLAGADGLMPNSLKFDCDQNLLDRALDAAALLVHGRMSHEAQPNSCNRRRLLMTRSAGPFNATPVEPNVWLWSPEATPFPEVCKTLGIECRRRRRARRHLGLRHVPAVLRQVPPMPRRQGELAGRRAGAERGARGQSARKRAAQGRARTRRGRRPRSIARVAASDLGAPRRVKQRIFGNGSDLRLKAGGSPSPCFARQRRARLSLRAGKGVATFRDSGITAPACARCRASGAATDTRAR